MRLIDANTAAAFAENCGAIFVAKRLRDSNAFPEVVTRCKNCVNGMKSGDNKYIICCTLGVGMEFDDFCSCGERKNGGSSDAID